MKTITITKLNFFIRQAADMDRRLFRVVEDLQGKGHLFDEDALLTSVTYKIQVVQEFFVIESKNTNHEIPGLKEIKGHVIVVESDRLKDQVQRILNSGKSLQLHLRDRRQLGIYTNTNGDPFSGIYKIIVGNAKGF